MSFIGEDMFEVTAPVEAKNRPGELTAVKALKAPVRSSQEVKNILLEFFADEDISSQGIVLAYPSNQNNALRPVKFGKRIGMAHTKEATHWLKEARQTVKEAELLPFTCAVCMTILVYPPANRGDIDGIIKKPMDALQASEETGGYGMYVNDKQVKRLVVDWLEVDKDNPRVEILVERLVRE